MNILLPIQAGTLPLNSCYNSEQERLVAFSANQWAILPGESFFNIGSTEPPADLRGYLWFRTTDSRWYQYLFGKWVTPHEFSPGRHLWEEFVNEAAIWSFDGGDGSNPTTNPPGPTTGAMWKIDPNYAGRSPMSPGDISGSDPLKTLGYAEDYGSGSHTMTEAELVEHDHTIKFATNDTGSGFPSGSTGNLEAFEETTEVTGDGDAFPIIHPVRGMACIVRTDRIYRTI